jgi:hypothetical protein
LVEKRALGVLLKKRMMPVGKLEFRLRPKVTVFLDAADRAFRVATAIAAIRFSGT